MLDIIVSDSATGEMLRLDEKLMKQAEDALASRLHPGSGLGFRVWRIQDCIDGSQSLLPGLQLFFR